MVAETEAEAHTKLQLRQRKCVFAPESSDGPAGKAEDCNPNSSPISGTNRRKPSSRSQRKGAAQPALSASLTLSLSLLQKDRASIGMEWTPSLLVKGTSDENTENKSKGENFNTTTEKAIDGGYRRPSIDENSVESDHVFQGENDTSIDKEQSAKVEARRRARRLKKKMARKTNRDDAVDTMEKSKGGEKKTQTTSHTDKPTCIIRKSSVKSNTNKSDTYATRKSGFYWNDNVETFLASNAESTQVNELVHLEKAMNVADTGLMNDIVKFQSCVSDKSGSFEYLDDVDDEFNKSCGRVIVGESRKDYLANMVKDSINAADVDIEDEDDNQVHSKKSGDKKSGDKKPGDKKKGRKEKGGDTIMGRIATRPPGRAAGLTVSMPSMHIEEKGTSKANHDGDGRHGIAHEFSASKLLKQNDRVKSSRTSNRQHLRGPNRRTGKAEGLTVSMPSMQIEENGTSKANHNDIGRHDIAHNVSASKSLKQNDRVKVSSGSNRQRLRGSDRRTGKAEGLTVSMPAIQMEEKGTSKANHNDIGRHGIADEFCASKSLKQNDRVKVSSRSNRHHLRDSNFVDGIDKGESLTASHSDMLIHFDIINVDGKKVDHHPQTESKKLSRKGGNLKTGRARTSRPGKAEGVSTSMPCIRKRGKDSAKTNHVEAFRSSRSSIFDASAQSNSKGSSSLGDSDNSVVLVRQGNDCKKKDNAASKIFSIMYA